MPSPEYVAAIAWAPPGTEDVVICAVPFDTVAVPRFPLSVVNDTVPVMGGAPFSEFVTCAVNVNGEPY